jgi:hypothetical protein
VIPQHPVDPHPIVEIAWWTGVRVLKSSDKKAMLRFVDFIE